ncbi:hypothetical protein KIL84_016925 [Mauremys mutica]|uniref:Uncharacterized protein n=1 Tax=Mauremys mutica TaxID=74926 RepID=A0A9D4AY52_9SAUR|nr:hypothetical protein KIL84_016925 [Mauremys mutica]
MSLRVSFLGLQDAGGPSSRARVLGDLWAQRTEHSAAPDRGQHSLAPGLCPERCNTATGLQSQPPLVLGQLGACACLHTQAQIPSLPARTDASHLTQPPLPRVRQVDAEACLEKKWLYRLGSHSLQLPAP